MRKSSRSFWTDFQNTVGAVTYLVTAPTCVPGSWPITPGVRQLKSPRSLARKGPMVSQSNGMPPGLTHAFDEQEAAISDVRRNNRANFEEMTRRSATGEPKVREAKVREAMAWFDAQRAH